MGKKVVVVDDDADMRLFSTTVLEENGFSPIEAANGEEGMEVIKNENPALVILDVLMPRESGVRLYRKLKSDKNLKHIPVIILSGVAQKSFLRSQKALTEFRGGTVPEPDAYLEKPVKSEELTKTIKAIVGEA